MSLPQSPKGLKVTDVSIELGYTDPSNFTHAP